MPGKRLPPLDDSRAADAAPEKIDGRRQRSANSRKAIVDAVIRLQEGGVAHATAAQIAKEAEVSLRTIFGHFPSEDGLTLAVMDEIGARHFGDLVTQTPDEPFAERMRKFVKRRAALLERLVVYRRYAAMVPSPTDAVRQRRRLVRQRMLEETRVVFAPELARHAPKVAKHLALAIAVTCESESWGTLRNTFDQSEQDAMRIMTLAIGRLLQQDA